MNQRTALQAMDAEVFEAFSAIGFADAAYYSSTSGSTVPCNVMIDRDVTVYGDDEMPVVTGQTVVTFQLREVAPAPGATITIGSERFELRTLLKQDESVSRWACALCEVSP